MGIKRELTPQEVEEILHGPVRNIGFTPQEYQIMQQKALEIANGNYTSREEVYEAVLHSYCKLVQSVRYNDPFFKED